MVDNKEMLAMAVVGLVATYVTPASSAAYYYEMTCADLTPGTASYTMSDCFAKTATLDTNSVAGFALGGAFAPGGGFIQFETTTTTTTTTTLVADAVVTCSDNDGATSNATVAFAGCTEGLEIDPWPAAACAADPCTVSECCYADQDAKDAAARAAQTPCQRLVPADEVSQVVCSIFGLNEQCCTCENARLPQSGTGVAGYFESNCTVETVQDEIADADDTEFEGNVGGTTGGACLSCCKSYNGTATDANGDEAEVSICTHRVCGGICKDQRTEITVVEVEPVAEDECDASDTTAQTIVTIALVLILLYYFGAAVFMMTSYKKPTQIHLD